MLPLTHYLWLVPLGIVVGAFGTLIGAGGGFILVPLLLLLYPNENPEIITSISLAVVFANALSGSVAYARMKRIDYHSGTWFAMAAIPGAILGAISTTWISRRFFDALFAALMITGSIFLFWKPRAGISAAPSKTAKEITRRMREADGTTHVFSYRRSLGVVLSIFVGYISSFLGIGGGVLHVPALVHLLNFPVHIATATSHFMLTIMSFTGTISHVAMGTFHHGVWRTVFLSSGVVIGAQAGARLSRRVRGRWILLGLASALAVAGLRILILAFQR